MGLTTTPLEHALRAQLAPVVRPRTLWVHREADMKHYYDSNP